MVSLTCFETTLHVSKHKTSHLQSTLYTGIYNMMFVTHTVIKESAGNAGGGYPSTHIGREGIPPRISWHLIIMFVKSHNYNSFYVMDIYIYIYVSLCVCVCVCNPSYNGISYIAGGASSPSSLAPTKTLDVCW